VILLTVAMPDRVEEPGICGNGRNPPSGVRPRMPRTGRFTRDRTPVKQENRPAPDGSGDGKVGEAGAAGI